MLGSSSRAQLSWSDKLNHGSVSVTTANSLTQFQSRKGSGMQKYRSICVNGATFPEIHSRIEQRSPLASGTRYNANGANVKVDRWRLAKPFVVYSGGAGARIIVTRTILSPLAIAPWLLTS